MGRKNAREKCQGKMLGKNGREKWQVKMAGKNGESFYEQPGNWNMVRQTTRRMTVADKQADEVTEAMRKTLSEAVQKLVGELFGPGASATVVLHTENAITGPVSLVVGVGDPDALAWSTQAALVALDALAGTTHDAPLVWH